MTPRTKRDTAAAAAASSAACDTPSPIDSKPEGMTWRDYLVQLLHLGAEIEHALMVEYLYAAYSLDSSGRPPAEQRMIERWRRELLILAREEMGHLATVQNVLTLFGAPICLDRGDFPWDHAFIPFPFTLEPLSYASLARYVFVEMPEPDDPAVQEMFSRKELAEVRVALRRVQSAITKSYPDAALNHVGKLYELILEIVRCPEKIPESCFLAETYPHQASWDDWGRNYEIAPRMLDAEGTVDPDAPAPLPAPRVLVLRMATRTDAVDALIQVAEQGEEPQVGRQKLRADRADGIADEPSHYLRFYRIWQEFGRMRRTHGRRWTPSRDIPTNPTATAADPTDPPAGYIPNANSRRWAQLFNLRYRMLLAYLSHTFRLARTHSAIDPSVRAPTMHRVFAEMYNLKAIAGILVQLPFSEGKARRKKSIPKFAGPPFELPYSLDLPDREADVWRMHRDLLTSAEDLVGTLLSTGGDDGGARYLKVLRDIDQQSVDWLDSIIKGTRA